MNLNEMLIAHKEASKEYVRKKRNDSGIQRGTYKAILPEKYRSYVSRANRKRIAFTLSQDEFNSLLSLPCVFCGSERNQTIDRMDSRGGYTQDNTQPCCYDCNMMKHFCTNENFIRQCRRIAKHLSLLDKQNYSEE